jgi:hypothetical protein
MSQQDLCKLLVQIDALRGVDFLPECSEDVVFMLLIACVAMGFQKIIPPVLNSFTDQDSRVRYYACEALYNIAKVGTSFLYLNLRTFRLL